MACLCIYRWYLYLIEANGATIERISKMAIVTKTSAATISRLLNSADILKSSAGAGRVSTVTTEGYSVTKNFDGQIIVQYVSSSSMKNDKVYEAFMARRTETLAKIASILNEKGYEFLYTEKGNIILAKAGA